MKAFLIVWVFGLCTHSFYEVQGCGGGASSSSSSSYLTNYRDRFGQECNSGQSLVNIRSRFSSEKEDRVWHFACRDNSYITSSCRWSLPANQYVNSHNGLVNFICPGEGYMVGIYGEAHNSWYGDRRFDFKCCDAKAGLGQTGCKWTDYVNDWEGGMDYKAPSGYYIAGAYSTHLNSYQDRRWKFYICR